MGFRIGDKVVYPHHGAATIESREKKELFGEKREYLILQTVINEMTLKVPVDMADRRHTIPVSVNGGPPLPIDARAQLEPQAGEEERARPPRAARGSLEPLLESLVLSAGTAETTDGAPVAGELGLEPVPDLSTEVIHVSYATKQTFGCVSIRACGATQQPRKGTDGRHDPSRSAGRGAHPW